MKRYTFREFLRNKFANGYNGLDDDMPDAEAEWFMDLDVEDVIDWADKWYEQLVQKQAIKPNNFTFEDAKWIMRPPQ